MLEYKSVIDRSFSRCMYMPLRNKPRVSLWDATHCNNASALQTRFEAAAVSCDGLSNG